MKFHNLSVRAKRLLNSKRNGIMIWRKIDLLIRYHNRMCLMLNRFNHFWKLLLVPFMLFYVVYIWFAAYITIFYPKLNILAKYFMITCLLEFTIIFAFIVIITFSVSIQVIIT